MTTNAKLKHIRFDLQTEKEYQEIINHLWTTKGLPGTPRDSEGHRLLVHTMYRMMFHDPEIDISTATI